MAPTPHLPQELIDLIIGEVVDQTVDDPLLRAECLRAISCVSKAFYHRAREELFSNVDFPRFRGDSSTQTRAATLLEILERNATSLRPVRTMRLVHDVRPKDWSPSPEFTSSMPLNLSRFLETSRGAVTRLAIQTGLQKDHVVSLLQKTFDSTALQSYAFEVYSGHLNWGAFAHHETCAILTGLYSNSSFRSLKFANIRDLPKAFILGDFSSTYYQELTLINTTINLSERTADEDYQVAARAVANIKTLTLWRLSYADIFGSLRAYLPQLPFGSRSRSPANYFSGLTTLRLTIPSHRYDMEVLWKFLLGVSRTLETLELRDFADPKARFPDFFVLSLLSHLKHFRIYGAALNHINGTNIKLETMAKILNSTAAPLKLESLEFGVCIQVHASQDFESGTNTPWDLRRLKWGVNWAVLDEVLLNPLLREEGTLRSIFLNIKIYRFEPDSGIEKTRYEDGRGPFCGVDLLPRASVLPEIQFRWNIEMIYSSKPMSFHLGEF